MRISEPAPGRRLGRYELLRPIGEGGMAQVWAARMDGSRGFQKIVALKTLIPALASDPQFQRMFLDEANLASKIHHRNVVEIYDLGDADGVLFLVMEFVEGPSMHRLLRPGKRPQPLPAAISARLVADAAHGLHAAHEQRDERGVPLGIVHRDVCPQNILIDRDGTVKVADFGIAKAIERVSDTTQTGEIKGKGEYMPPEQAQGRPVDRRSDIYSLGVVLFEAVTGLLPFQVLYDMETPPPSSSQPPRPSSVAPGCPRDLEEIIVTALARDRTQRFQTADEMAGALENFLMRTSGAVMPTHVADILQARCGDKMAELRQTLSAASPSQRPRRLPRPGALLSGSTSQPPPRSQLSSDVRAALGHSSRPGGSRPFALPWVIAAISVGVAISSLAFVALSRRAEPRPGRGGRLPPHLAQPSVVAPYGAPIALKVVPRDAVVRLNGAVIGVGDQLIARPAPGGSLTVEVKVNGVGERTVVLTSESPDQIELRLDGSP